MGRTREHFQTLFFAAIFSPSPDAIAWGRRELERVAGSVALESPLFDFVETTFYAETMGAKLLKQLFVFEEEFDPADLPDRKLLSNALEQQYREAHPSDVERPINIDPGYLSEAKLVLATTTDRDHRIYLRDGIYGEVTLYYLRSGWQYSRWTYPDYRRADYFLFLNQARKYLRKRIQTEG